MKNYTSCFLGIPLPQEYQKEFEQLLLDISLMFPELELVAFRTPHITIYYLDKQSKFALSEIKEVIKNKTNILVNLSLTVGGFGYFSENNPKVLFLEVNYPSALTDFNKEIVKTLIKYSALDNNLPFHPHVSLGRIKSIQAQENFKKVETNLKTKLSNIRWGFQIKELVLYGVDSTKSPEYQEKLLTIPVG